MSFKQDSLKEKAYRAERNLAAIRLGVIVFNSIAYLLLRRGLSDAIGWMALVTIAIAVPYALIVVWVQPYRRFPVLISSYFTSISDALLITIWLAATGGFDSPFFPVWYASIAAIAFRFGMRETLLTATLYALSTIGLVVLTEPIFPSVLGIVSHIVYIYFVGMIGALLAHEFYQQINAKLQAEEQYRQIVENAAIGIHQTTLDGHITSANASLARMLGYESTEQLKSLATPEQAYIDAARRLEFRRIVTTNGRITNFESQIRRRDGSLVWIAESARALRDEGDQVIGFEGTIEDITARRESDALIQKHNRQLIQANKELAIARRKSEEASRLKHEFLANMSHELRTPLNAIMGYTEILIEGIAGVITDKQRDNLKRILQNAENLLGLINSVLDLSKIEAGRVELIRESFEIRTWLHNIENQIEGLAKTKGLQFKTIVNPAVPVYMMGDSERLKQIVINLLSNAIKFTEKGDVTLSISVEAMNTWMMTITDTGIGIPSHAMEFIFDEFRQVDGGSRRKYAGTGLGLAIVRDLVAIMEGTIKVVSELGTGSTFIVTLPMLVEVNHKRPMPV